MVAPSQRHSNTGGKSKYRQDKNEAGWFAMGFVWLALTIDFSVFGSLAPSGKYIPYSSNLRSACKGEKTRPNQLRSIKCASLVLGTLADEDGVK